MSRSWGRPFGLRAADTKNGLPHDLAVGPTTLLISVRKSRMVGTMCQAYRRLGARSGWRFALAATIAVVQSAGAVAAEGGSADVWPPLRLGVWESVTTRVLPSGRKETWKSVRKVCTHPRSMFIGYSGLKQVGKGGCAFESTKLSDNTYRLHIRCDVKGGGEAEGILTMQSEDSFELKMTTKEGKQSIPSTKTGHRVGDCPTQGSGGRDE